MVIISIKVDRALLDRIDSTAREEGANRSETIRRYLGAVISWRRDRATWAAATAQGESEGIPPRAALFAIIGAALSAVRRSPAPAIAVHPLAATAPAVGAPAPNASKRLDC